MTIRCAILGYGRSGSTMHAGAVEALSDRFNLVALCDIDPDRQEQARERFDPTIYDDYHAMLRDEQLELVIVVTRSDQHCQMTIDCLEAGVDVLVTKPWATCLDEARRMVEAEKRTGRTIYPWLPARWGADYLELKKLVDDGAVGNVFHIRRRHASFGTRDDWQTQHRYGGGYVLNWGPHLVDPPVLMGGAPAHSAFAVLRKVNNPGDAEDNFLAIVTLDNCVTVQSEHTVSTQELPGWIIQGDRGTIVVHGNRMTLKKQTPKRPDDPTKTGDMKADEAETIEREIPVSWGDTHHIYGLLADAIEGGEPYPVTSTDALELSRILEAIKTSGAEHRVVMIDR